MEKDPLYSARTPIKVLHGDASSPSAPVGDMVFVRKTPYEMFERRGKVKEECPGPCLDLYRGFRTQRRRESDLARRQKELKKQRLRAVSELNFRQKDPAGKAEDIIRKTALTLDRGINIFGGFLRTVNKDLDEAENLLEQAGIDEDESVARGIAHLRRREQTHNWAYLQDLSMLLGEALRREEEYARIIRSMGADVPFPPLASFIDAGSPADANLDMYASGGFLPSYEMRSSVRSSLWGLTPRRNRTA